MVGAHFYLFELDVKHAVTRNTNVEKFAHFHLFELDVKFEEPGITKVKNAHISFV